MTVHEFDPVMGVFKFEITDLETGFHAHPATEILYAKTGNLILETPEKRFTDIHFAIIERNTIHKVFYEGTRLDILMLECAAQVLPVPGESFDNGIYAVKLEQEAHPRMAAFEESYRQRPPVREYDERVKLCLEYLNTATTDYLRLIQNLCAITHLSESRISHLFKQETGISIKKYHVWAKLKKTMALVIFNHTSMYQSSLEAGFYDQAHLSHAFKKMLGISPSEVYNSSTLQM